MVHHICQRSPRTGLMIFCLLFAFASSIAFGRQLTVIELMHRPAEEVMPVITPFLGPADTISSHGHQLFLNTTPENLSRIQAIVAHLDRAAQQLAITVVRGERTLSALTALSISGNITIGKGVTIGTGSSRGEHQDSVTVDAQSERHSIHSSDIQRVLVQEGNTAVIYVGLSTPVAMDGSRHQGKQFQQIVGYRQMLTGVQITPRLTSDRVTLAIETRREQPAGNPPVTVATQQIRTRISGRLNEWIEIGGILSEAIRTGNGLTHGGSDRQTDQNKIFLRVETIH